MFDEKHAWVCRRETGKEKWRSAKNTHGFAIERGRQGMGHDVPRRPCVVIQKREGDWEGDICFTKNMHVLWGT
jgi:hypothetical protein